MSTVGSKQGWSWLSYLVHRVEPVKRALFDTLTASEVSLLAVLLRYELTEREGHRWLNPIRDIAEHEEWIKKMVKAGHAVTLIGKDVSLLLGRINDPIGFWSHFHGREKLVIWLSVLHQHASMEWLAQNYQGHPSHQTVMTEEGNVVVMGSQDPDQSTAPAYRLRTMFIAPPGDSKGYARDSDGLDWYQSSKRNESNLDVVFFRSAHAFNSSTVACVAALPAPDAIRYANSRHLTFNPALVEQVTAAVGPHEAYHVQTTFLNLNSSKQAFSARSMMPSLGGDKLRIGLDIPYVLTREDSPIMVIPVSFHSTNMVTFAGSCMA